MAVRDSPSVTPRATETGSASRIAFLRRARLARTVSSRQYRYRKRVQSVRSVQFVSRMISFSGFDKFRQLGNDPEGVAHNQQVRELANRRRRVLIDRDDRPGGTHADFVLNRAGDAYGDVEGRRYGLSGLSNLKIIGHPAGVGRGPRSADGAAQGPCQGLQ